jgi:hypothetical protein
MAYCQVKTTIQSVDMIRLYSESLHAQVKNWLKGKISCKTLLLRWTKVLPHNMEVGSIRLTTPAGGFSPANHNPRKTSGLDKLFTIIRRTKVLPQNMEVGSIRLTSPAGGFSPAKRNLRKTAISIRGSLCFGGLESCLTVRKSDKSDSHPQSEGLPRIEQMTLAPRNATHEKHRVSIRGSLCFGGLESCLTVRKSGKSDSYPQY